jgi:hypothetical protein
MDEGAETNAKARGGASSLAIMLILAALLGPAITYSFWKRYHYLHRLHTEGIETRAEILDAEARLTQGVISYSFDLRWRLSSGEKAEATAIASRRYAAKFVYDPLACLSAEDGPEVLAKTALVKYLVDDPGTVMFHLDPENAEEGPMEGLEVGAALSAAGIGALVFYVAGLVRRRAGRKEVKEEHTPVGRSITRWG